MCHISRKIKNRYKHFWKPCWSTLDQISAIKFFQLIFYKISIPAWFWEQHISLGRTDLMAKLQSPIAFLPCIESSIRKKSAVLRWELISCQPNVQNFSRLLSRLVRVIDRGGGQGKKKSCWANMKDLFAGKQMLFTELQNSAAFKS